MENFCQSCGMPLNTYEELFGTNADGGKNTDYCKYCYENGAFTSQTTMDEMIEVCIPPMLSANNEMTEQQAREMMRQFFPTLKRWK